MRSSGKRPIILHRFVSRNRNLAAPPHAFGSDRGGRAAAILVSFTHTCKSLNLDPFAYLRDILARIATHPIKNLAQLLPDHWQPLT